MEFRIYKQLEKKEQPRWKYEKASSSGIDNEIQRSNNNKIHSSILI